MTVIVMPAAFPLPTLPGLSFDSVLLTFSVLLRCFIHATILIPVISYLAMPTMTRLILKWRYPTEPHEDKNA